LGYVIESTHWGIEFDKTEGMFTDLIRILNEIKVRSSRRLRWGDNLMKVMIEQNIVGENR
jgi:hypothetical protein